MIKKNYCLSENLILRVCACFKNQELKNEDYLPKQYSDGDEVELLCSSDKEFVCKSRIMGVTHEGMVEHSCCPLHANQGLIPIMKTIKAEFKIGKGNVGFGSAFYALDPSSGVDDFGIIEAQKKVGCFANLAYKYDNKEYVHMLAKYHMLPLVVTETLELPFRNDDYILLKDIHKNIEQGNPPEAYLVKPEKGLERIEIDIINKA